VDKCLGNLTLFGHFIISRNYKINSTYIDSFSILKIKNVDYTFSDQCQTGQTVLTMPGYIEAGAVFIKLLRNISYLSENFKCIFLIKLQLHLNENFHAYEKTTFFICMQGFIAVV